MIYHEHNPTPHSHIEMKTSINCIYNINNLGQHSFLLNCKVRTLNLSKRKGLFVCNTCTSWSSKTVYDAMSDANLYRKLTETTEHADLVITSCCWWGKWQGILIARLLTLACNHSHLFSSLFYGQWQWS